MSSPKTGMMQQIREEREDTSLLDTPGSGDIIPTFAVLGVPCLGMLLWTVGGDWSQVTPLIVLWYGSLGVQAIFDRKRVAAIMEAVEVDGYGSSGSFLRFLGNLGIAALVILPIVGIAHFVGLA